MEIESHGFIVSTKPLTSEVSSKHIYNRLWFVANNLKSEESLNTDDKIDNLYYLSLAHGYSDRLGVRYSEETEDQIKEKYKNIYNPN